MLLRSLVLSSVALLSCVSGPKPAPSAPVCGDVASFRASALQDAKGDGRASLERWQPGAPVADGDRKYVSTVAREYLRQCGAAEVTELTSKLVAFRTVSAEQSAADGQDFKDLAAFLQQWAQQHGMSFNVFGANDAWELSLGEGPAGIGFVAHADVVPASTNPDPKAYAKLGAVPPGWNYPAFKTTRIGDKLYGRGTEDDKGPAAAAMVMMDTLRRFGLTPRMRMVVIFGTGEEHDWDGMERYVAANPPPKFAISVDSNFPLVIGENGWVAWHLSAPPRSGKAIKCAEVTDVRVGEFITQVPGEGTLTLRPGMAESVDQLLARAQQLAAEEQRSRGAPYRLDATRKQDSVVLRAQGKACHSSVPEEGSNAMWALSQLATRVGICDGGAGSLLRMVAERMDGDHYAAKLKLAYSHPVQGPLVSAPTMLTLVNGVPDLGINLRRPAGMTNADFARRLDETTRELGQVYGITEKLADRHIGDPHLVDDQGPLVQTLLDVYRHEANDPQAKPISIRGGTYARLFPGGISFGPSLPGRPYLGHAPDEYIEVSTLDFQTRALFEAALRLDPLTVPTK